MPKPPAPLIAPVGAALVGADLARNVPTKSALVVLALVEDALVEAGSLRLLTEQVAIPVAPGRCSSFSGLGSALAPPRQARLLGCWPVPRPHFPIMHPDQA